MSIAHRVIGDLTIALFLMACTSGEDETGVVTPVRGSATESSGFQTAYSEEDFLQHVRFKDDVFTLKNSYWVGSEWSQYLYDFTTSYTIRSVVSQTLDKFVIHGVADNGDGILERWIVKKVAQPGNPWSQGGPLTMTRTELYRGSSLGTIAEVGADPDGRFVLVAHGSPAKLSKLSLTTGHPITTLFTVAQIPFLADVYGMVPMQHLSEGRLWFVEQKASRDVLVLHDLTNDGVFESWEVLPGLDWESRYAGPVWADDFVNHH